LPRHVLVLNTTYEPINVCSTRRAVVLLLKGKAEALECGSQILRSESCSVILPQVIRLRSFARIPWGERRRISRRAILARDGYVCQYCGSAGRLTLDHVIPRSRGGTTSWDNVVASCAPCNTRKGSSLPQEVGMAPLSKPRPPAPADFLLPVARDVPDSWAPYLTLAVA
jgi:5-methylcytosine-specific restriction endonuclease McrA